MFLMSKNYSKMQILKRSLIVLAVLFLSFAYICIAKQDLERKLEDISHENIKLSYKVYKKIYAFKIPPDVLYFKNDDFIDMTKIKDELAQAIPFIDKKSNKKDKYCIIYAFTSEAKKKKVEYLLTKLNKDEYFIQTKENTLELFGIVPNKGYVLISKNIQNTKNLNSAFDNVFYKIFAIFLLNIIFFLIFIFIFRYNKQYIFDAEKELNNLLKDTKNLAFEDTLTKAASRLKFDETLKHLIQVASRFPQNYFSIIMIDIDDFKKINDTYGHDYGDVVLQTLAKNVMNNIRDSDIFARWGGEEFVLVLPQQGLKEAVQIAEKLRQKFEKIDFEKLEKFSCSFGVSVFQCKDTPKSLMKRADENLYKAKRNGKNQVVAEQTNNKEQKTEFDLFIFNE